jgi:hypothetical protein
MNAISHNKITRRRYLITKSHEGDTSQQNCAKETSPNNNNNGEQSFHSLSSLAGSSFTMYPIRVSSPKTISHSLRSILVEGEYCLSTNDFRICGEIAPGASDKIYTAFLFVEPFPRLFGRATYGPGASFNKTFSLLRFVCLSVFLTNACGFTSRGATSGITTMEAPPRLTSSKLSISGHNSPMFTLDDPISVASRPSSRWGPAPKEKTDKLEELEISITSPLGMST